MTACEAVSKDTSDYSVPNGLICPFCTYNVGHTFRGRVEKAFILKRQRVAGSGQ
ncbi:MAG: hypothetical protein HY265_05630 [Deltaproteobacteria bacterium]|nr:hypothetical protein [Deltaproteobacteria bacterium]MBI3755622.1 hypothetical protein [Deltaproteobacteria bacterium]